MSEGHIGDGGGAGGGKPVTGRGNHRWGVGGGKTREWEGRRGAGGRPNQGSRSPGCVGKLGWRSGKASKYRGTRDQRTWGVGGRRGVEPLSKSGLMRWLRGVRGQLSTENKILNRGHQDISTPLP